MNKLSIALLMPDTLSLERLFYVSEKLGKLATKRERHHATMQTDIGTPVVPEPIQKEIKMFTHRLFNLFVAIALVAVIALTAQVNDLVEFILCDAMDRGGCSDEGSTCFGKWKCSQSDAP